MKIYFSGSIGGGRQDQEIYRRLIEHLKHYGEVLTEHIGDPELTEAGEDLDPGFVYERDMAWLKESTVVIAEITAPSFGVGYEVSKVEDWRKPMCCLYRLQEGKRLSGMAAGNRNLKLKQYRTIDEAISHIDNFFSSLRK